MDDLLKAVIVGIISGVIVAKLTSSKQGLAKGTK